MKPMEWLRRIWYWINRNRFERELLQEMEAHRELMGDPKGFGNTLRLREESRDVWGWNWIDDLWRDLRFGFRTLRHSVGFSLGAVLILSLGIGLNLGNFQLMDTLFWSPPKLRDPATLVRFDWRAPRTGGSTVPYPMAQVVASNATFLSAVLVRMEASDVGGVVWADDTGPAIRASFVSANWFTEVDYRPLLGRVFQPGIDDVPDAPPVVVISRGVWKNRFNEDPSIVGTTVRINKRPATIIGVVPPNIFPRHDASFWMPAAQMDYFIPGTPLKTSWDFRTNRAEIYGRLKPGVSLAAAREASKGLMSEVAAERPDVMRPGGWLEPFSAVAYFHDADRRWRDLLSFAASGGTLTLLILLIACANLSNLILSRTTSRLREFAIRSSLGANRWRVIRHLLSESAVLVAFGSAGGIVLVYWMSRMVTSLWEYAPDFTPNLRTVFAGLLIGGFTIAAVGLIPALKLSRADLAAIMKDGGAQSSMALSKTRFKQFFLAAQVAASCVLLILAGLMLRSTQRIQADVGFDVEKVVIVSAPLRAQGVSATQIASYWNSMRNAVASNAETESAALVARSPFDDPAVTIALPNGSRLGAKEVGPEFFKVMAITIVAGRAFDSSDEFRTTIIVSKSLAMKTYGTLDVVGQLFPQSGERRTIVGVADNARLRKIDQPDPLVAYIPLNPAVPDREMIIRAAGDPRTLMTALRAAAQSFDDRVISDVHLLSRDFANRTVESRSMTVLLSALAVLAIFLTCVGLVGIVSQAATLRRKELGIRIALGANRRTVVHALVRDVRWALLAGIIFGVFAGAALGGIFSGVPLFVKPFDPPILLAASLFLAAVATVAAMIPAWRALRADVVDSLRSE